MIYHWIHSLNCLFGAFIVDLFWQIKNFAQIWYSSKNIVLERKERKFCKYKKIFTNSTEDLWIWNFAEAKIKIDE